MIKFRNAVLVMVVLADVCSGVLAQSAFIRTEGADGKAPMQTFAAWDDTYEIWLQSFNTDSFTIRGGPLQKLDNGMKLSECLAWTPKTGALAVNVNTGNATVCQKSKTFWELGAYAPLNDASSWALVLYDARLLARLTPELAIGPVAYGKWSEGAGNDFLSAGVAVEYRVKGGCFYGRLARNLVSDKNEFRLQYAFGF
ncbi:MAG: hypothetical protein WCG99_01445 [Candidatus Berkelbacteria bacterium]